MGPGTLLGFLAGALTPSPSFGEVRAAVRPNPYARAMPAQVAHVAAVASPLESIGIQPDLSGHSGSEADWADVGELWSGDDSAGLQHITNGLARSAPMPASWYAPHLPAELVEGRGTGYVTDAYNKGFVDLQAAGPTSWGASSGYGSSRPNVQAGTLLYPTETTPAPATMANDYANQNQGHTRLSDMFGD